MLEDEPRDDRTVPELREEERPEDEDRPTLLLPERERVVRVVERPDDELLPELLRVSVVPRVRVVDDEPLLRVDEDERPTLVLPERVVERPTVPRVVDRVPELLPLRTAEPRVRLVVVDLPTLLLRPERTTPRVPNSSSASRPMDRPVRPRPVEVTLPRPIVLPRGW